MQVTATVSTKDRYKTTLSHAIAGVALQTVRPKQLVIFDDGEMKDIRNESPYRHLFPLLMSKGIQWFHIPGGRIGQVANHQTALDRADTELVWRIDDDEVPEPNCLEELLKPFQDPTVGAVGGLVLDPSVQAPRPGFLSGRIDEILNPFNIAWYRWDGAPEEVDHLYSTFLYRAEAGQKAGGYERTLSPVGHREETLFTHSIKRAGYRVLVTPKAVTWHLRESTGGIRSYTNQSFWDRDESFFRGKLAQWGVTPKEYKVVVLDNGMGDHIVFKSILPELFARSKGEKLILAVCYPEIFEGVQGVTLASIADAKAAFGNLDRFDIYRFCEERNWKGSLEEAFRAKFL